ncbi:hypothetical protein LTR78_007068 [Recurvomyces mirabilis]|uniref:Uncharacterized protein n=1 Tax=Recurvomyces mirabilis TaxID=574656 RepID=A0AAE0WJR1_9PEZI|nr:hypothetical protein LTR78_007068 [Recurvomyces mirabilis]KAK5150960.1 hypothetical protein LTS14_009764 [Recurvomyces mirabilis]
MPPKKHARSTSSANVESTAKRPQKEADVASGPSQEKDTNDSVLEPEYICIHATLSDDREDEDSDEVEVRGEDEDDEGPTRTIKMSVKDQSVFRKLASNHPEHKWIMMWQTYMALTDAVDHSGHSDPDLFGMHVYNDFHWYGLAELLENMTAYQKSTVETALLDLWASIAALGHWVNMNTEFMMMDDGDRAFNLIGLIGCAFIDTLITVDKAGQLSADSIVKDLGLVMSLYLNFGRGQEDYDIEEGDLQWRSAIVAFAKKAGIDLTVVGCSATAENVRNEEEEAEEDITADLVKGFREAV